MDEKNVKNVDELKEYETYYSDKSFLEKVGSVFAKAGETVVRPALLLYYVLKSGNVSARDRAIIIGALGYFILPLDLIPDIIPVLGFTDDASAIAIAYKAVKNNITPEIKQQAEEKLSEWFG